MRTPDERAPMTMNARIARTPNNQLIRRRSAPSCSCHEARPIKPHIIMAQVEASETAVVKFSNANSPRSACVMVVA